MVLLICIKRCNKEDFFFVKKVFFFFENVRNQGENFEKFKERPLRLRNLSSEKIGNLRNKPSTGKTPPFLMFRYWVYIFLRLKNTSEFRWLLESLKKNSTSVQLKQFFSNSSINPDISTDFISERIILLIPILRFRIIMQQILTYFKPNVFLPTRIFYVLNENNSSYLHGFLRFRSNMSIIYFNVANHEKS